MQQEQTQPITVILPVSLIRKLEVLAEQEQRKLGPQIRKMLVDATARNGRRRRG